MTSRIRISWPGGELFAALDATPTARAVLGVLPCEAAASTWGEEVYFRVPARVVLEADARQVVDPGTVCFWVEGGSLALPYGPTPIATEGECRLVARVNVLGRIEGDPRRLESVRDGDTVCVEHA